VLGSVTAGRLREMPMNMQCDKCTAVPVISAVCLEYLQRITLAPYLHWATSEL